MQVFKFGGASVSDAQAVRNVLSVIQNHGKKPLMVVVSAMGKTTNALEMVWQLREQGQMDKANAQLDVVVEKHNLICNDLFLPESEGFEMVSNLWSQLSEVVQESPAADRDYEYDRIVPFGELVSTTIISVFLNENGQKNTWFDARKLICTDAIFREAGVVWPETIASIKRHWSAMGDSEQKMAITQGFIGADPEGRTTTLGREGSDYSAAILAFALEAESVTIWKDVPGVLNADPKFFEKTHRLPRISYREAIELSYFGASVIHPKTIKPLQNAGIPLYVRCFMDPNQPGTEIQSSPDKDAETPSFIFKTEQVLISISPRDFSFIVEENLSKIFGLLAQERIHVNLMQHSAVSFSVCVDRNPRRLQRLLDLLTAEFEVRYNEPVVLLTIRYYTEPLIDELVGEREVLVEQRSRNTARFVLRD